MAGEINPIEYQQLHLCMSSWDHPTSVAELHGLFSGLLCGGGRLPANGLLGLMMEHFGLDNAPDSEDQKLVVSFYKQILRELSAEDLSYQLYISDEEESVEQRSDDLHVWCEGFLVGLGTALQKRKLDELSDDSQEVLQDIVEISKLAPEDDDGEEIEAALFEISEYLRMAALLLFAELNENEDQQDDKPTLH